MKYLPIFLVRYSVKRKPKIRQTCPSYAIFSIKRFFFDVSILINFMSGNFEKYIIYKYDAAHFGGIMLNTFTPLIKVGLDGCV